MGTAAGQRVGHPHSTRRNQVLKRFIGQTIHIKKCFLTEIQDSRANQFHSYPGQGTLLTTENMVNLCFKMQKVCVANETAQK